MVDRIEQEFSLFSFPRGTDFRRFFLPRAKFLGGCKLNFQGLIVKFMRIIEIMIMWGDVIVIIHLFP